jgi:hypothetical protein
LEFALDDDARAVANGNDDSIELQLSGVDSPFLAPSVAAQHAIIMSNSAMREDAAP